MATSSEIKEALARRYSQDRYFFTTECKTGPTTEGLLIFDGLAISKSWAHPNIIGLEIKVSRSDFLRDSKYSLYLPYCHEFYYIVPQGMIERSELANDIGLIYFNEKNQTLRIAKQAVHRRVDISSSMLMYIIMSKLDQDRYSSSLSRKQLIEMYVQGEKDSRDLGNRFQSKLIVEINDLKKQLSWSTDRGYKEYHEIEEVFKKHEEYPFHMAERIDELLSQPDLDAKQIQWAVDNLERGLGLIKKEFEKAENKKELKE